MKLKVNGKSVMSLVVALLVNELMYVTYFLLLLNIYCFLFINSYTCTQWLLIA